MDPGKCLADVISDPQALVEFLRSNSQFQSDINASGSISSASFQHLSPHTQSQSFQRLQPQYQLLQQASQQQFGNKQQQSQQQQQQQQQRQQQQLQQLQQLYHSSQQQSLRQSRCKLGFEFEGGHPICAVALGKFEQNEVRESARTPTVEPSTDSDNTLAAELNSSLDFLASIAAAASQDDPKSSGIPTSNRPSQFDGKSPEFMYSNTNAAEQTSLNSPGFGAQSPHNIQSPLSGQAHIRNAATSSYSALAGGSSQASSMSNPSDPKVNQLISRTKEPPQLQPVGTLAAQILARTSGSVPTQASSSTLTVTDSPPPPTLQRPLHAQKLDQKASQKQTQKHVPNILMKSVSSSNQSTSNNQTILLPANMNGKLLIVNSPGKPRQAIALAPAVNSGQRTQAMSSGQQLFLQQKGQQLFVVPQTMQQKILTQSPVKGTSDQMNVQGLQQQTLVSHGQPTTLNFGSQQISNSQAMHSPSSNMQGASQNLPTQRQSSPLQPRQPFQAQIRPQATFSTNAVQNRNLQPSAAMASDRANSPGVFQSRNSTMPIRPQTSSNLNLIETKSTQGSTSTNPVNVRLQSAPQQRGILPKGPLPTGSQPSSQHPNILPKTSLPQNVVVVGKPKTSSGQTQRLSHFPVPVQKAPHQQIQSLQRTVQQRSPNQASSPAIGQTHATKSTYSPQKSQLSLAQQQASEILQQIVAVAGKSQASSAPLPITSAPVFTQTQTTSAAAQNVNPQVQVNLLRGVALQQLLQLRQSIGQGSGGSIGQGSSGQASSSGGVTLQKTPTSGQQQVGPQKLHHLDLPQQQQQQQAAIPQRNVTISSALQSNIQAQQFTRQQDQGLTGSQALSRVPKAIQPSASILDTSIRNLLNQQSSEVNRQMQQLLSGQQTVQSQAQSSPNINVTLSKPLQSPQSNVSQHTQNKEAIAQKLFTAGQITQAQLTELQKKLVIGKIMQQLQQVQPKPLETPGSSITNKEISILEGDKKPSTSGAIQIKNLTQPTQKTVATPKGQDLIRQTTLTKNLPSNFRIVSPKVESPTSNSSKVSVSASAGLQRKVNPPILQPAKSRTPPVVTLSSRISPTVKTGTKLVIPGSHASRKTPVSVVPSVPKVVIKPDKSTLKSKPLTVEQQKALVTKRLQHQLSQLTPAQREQLLRHQRQLEKKGQPVPLSKLLLQLNKADMKTNKPVSPVSQAPKRPLKAEVKKEEVPTESPVTKRLKHCLTADQTRVIQPEFKKPFRSVEDALSRLLPYHIYHEPLPQFKDWQKGETIFNIVAKQLITRKEKLVDKYHLLMLEESQRDVASSEMVMLERIFLNDEKAQLSQDKEDAKTGKFKIPTQSDESEEETTEEVTEEKLSCVEEMEDEICESIAEDNDSTADSEPQSDTTDVTYEKDMSTELSEATSNLLADLADDADLQEDSNYSLDNLII